MKFFIKKIAFVVLFVLASCNKQNDFLDAKPNDALSTPSSLNDLSLLLNNEELFNGYGDPALGAISGEEYYVLTSYWQSLYTEVEKNAYIWDSNIYDANSTNTNDWDKPYKQIYYANTVLDYLPNIERNTNNSREYDQIKGSAFFLRAYALYGLAQTYAMPYDSTTYNTLLGIPIRLSSDPNEKSTRPTIKNDYEQILEDAKLSLNLLTDFADKPTQPSRWAAYAFLARVYLAIGNYQSAYNYADSCLKMKMVLNDYSQLTPNGYGLASGFMDEDIYHRTLTSYTIMGRGRAIIDSSLYAMYDSNDLRRTKLFWLYRDGIRFQGSYDFKYYQFSGLAVDEILLNRAESAVRIGLLDVGLADLNYLLQYRYEKGLFLPLSYTEETLLLQRILVERRKELVFRGLRWTDLRRLNLEKGYKDTLIRVINGATYELLPNDKKYALPIPYQEIQLSGISQNDR